MVYWTFSVAAWGRSRNHLFSGSNFETLWTALRRPFALTGKQQRVETSDRKTEGRVSFQCTLMEIMSLGLIAFIAFAEGASQLFTDNVQHTTITFAFRNATVRSNNSMILQHLSPGNPRKPPQEIYSRDADVLFSRRCAMYEEGTAYITKPNLIVEATFPSWGGKFFSLYNMSAMCLYDEEDKEARNAVIHTLFERQRNKNISTGIQQCSTLNLKLKKYQVGSAKIVSVPHFSDLPKTTPTAAELQRPRLLLLELDGQNFTCTIDWVAKHGVCGRKEIITKSFFWTRA